MTVASSFVDRVVRAERASQPASLGLRVLVADDEPNVLEALRIGLRSEGCVVRAVTSAGTLVQAVTEGEYDVALLDLRCAGSPTPFDLLAQIRGLDPTLPIVVMAAWGEVERAVEAVRRGASEYIQKPWDTMRLVATVHGQAARGAALRRARRLEHETSRLRALGLPKLIARAPVMAPVLRLVELAASSSSHVLLSGDRGTGKRAIARWIHGMSERAARPLVEVDASRSSEAEIFGQITVGPDRSERPGCIELADGGSLLVSNVASLPLPQQARLLAVLRTGEVRPLGASRARSVDVRLLVCSAVDLEQEVRAGRLRADLFERLATRIRLPTLRERPQDVPLLAAHFVERFADRRKAGPALTEDATNALLAHTWPGNVRELELAIERALLVCGAQDLAPSHLALGTPTAPPAASPDALPLVEVERLAIRRALAQTDGNVVLAARALGLSRSAMYRRLQVHGIPAGPRKQFA